MVLFDKTTERQTAFFPCYVSTETPITEGDVAITLTHRMTGVAFVASTVAATPLKTGLQVILSLPMDTYNGQYSYAVAVGDDTVATGQAYVTETTFDPQILETQSNSTLWN